MLELTHLRILQALDEAGTLTRAAERLCLTQSALSHQIRQLESRSGATIWKREGRQLVLTPAGRELLALGRRLLPQVDDAEAALRDYACGLRGSLRIGVECYPCHEWLNGAIGPFLREQPDVEVDILGQVQFSGIEGLVHKQVDMLITPDPHPHPSLRYEALFDYELVLLLAKDHPLAGEPRIEAEALAAETLLSFPVPAERLDIFSAFLWPAAVRPRRHKRLHSVEIMVQLAAHRRGVCALPDWLAARYAQRLQLRVLRLGSSGVHKTLHAAVRAADADLPYVRRFVDLGRSATV